MLDTIHTLYDVSYREFKFSGTHGDGNIHFPCSADHGQDWQPYPVDPYLLYM